MTNLEPQADKAVRDAVDAFMEGRLNPEFAGETVFETKNSRYRLLDGVVYAAPVDTLIGSELVGWLMETTRRSVVGSAWQPGARAVLVDRHRGRNITVTSTTRLLHLEPSVVEAAPAPAPQRARLFPSSPPPPILAPPPPPEPPPRPSPVQSAALLQKRAAALHLPPRPIAPGAAPSAPFTPAAPAAPAIPVPARPLPLPAPPPRRDAFGGLTPPAQARTPTPDPPPPSPPAEPSGAWELISSEFELDEETRAGGSEDRWSLLDRASPGDLDSLDASTDEMLGEPESATDAPILLVRPISPGGPRSPT
jgi:hypothetical protein